MTPKSYKPYPSKELWIHTHKLPHITLKYSSERNFILFSNIQNQLKKRYLQSVSLILQFLIDRLIHTFYIFQQYQSQKEGNWCEVLNVRIM